MQLDPNLVIIELGGNDFLEQVPKETTLKNLREMILKIQARGAMVALCDVASGIFLFGYRSDYRGLAKDTGSIFIPHLLQAVLTKSELKADEIHPNSAGYKMMADNVYKAIKPYISETTR